MDVLTVAGLGVIALGAVGLAVYARRRDSDEARTFEVTRERIRSAQEAAVAETFAPPTHAPLRVVDSGPIRTTPVKRAPKRLDTSPRRATIPASVNQRGAVAGGDIVGRDLVTQAVVTAIVMDSAQRDSTPAPSCEPSPNYSSSYDSGSSSSSYDSGSSSSFGGCD